MAKSDDIHPDWIPATPDTVPPSGWILVRDVATGQDYWADPAKIKQRTPVTALTCEQVDRIKLIADTFREHIPPNVQEFLDNFRRDDNPAHEIQIWEALVDVYKAEMADRRSPSRAERKTVFGILLTASMLGERAKPETILSAFPQAKKLSHLERVCDRYRQRRFGQ